ncbi:hypothetical protein scyTo_0007975 [Scyliorhinus torazame]|uniref:Uncharacterized protein n=1 Tax=Scyliorhinus torazame TaxID=75743 RepID=A0A401P1K4_SCYTO|nr:hypothetical protein [Scyliorhinus torazame]
MTRDNLEEDVFFLSAMAAGFFEIRFGKLFSASVKMGCGLPKQEKPDENSPGKIYSTLNRPQVETKVGIAYQYKLLDFTTAETEITESSAAKLSSIHDLPTQLHELYQKGFVLAGFHPFIQSIDVWKKTPEEKMFRAILIKPAAR